MVGADAHKAPSVSASLSLFARAAVAEGTRGSSNSWRVATARLFQYFSVFFIFFWIRLLVPSSGLISSYLSLVRDGFLSVIPAVLHSFA